ncbi:DUF1385 domain-containing protein [Synergistaceae bacterium OttesenSCG-928-I11]|nr:DUF1385 domain-containing protein [Synergistaceae bacterium OttesenSCG-928-I11]
MNAFHRIYKVTKQLPQAAFSLWADEASCCNTIDESKRIPVGGQAVIEGVLMKGPEHWGLVVREPDGALWSKAWLGADWLKKGAWKWPVVRGFANMVEMMRVGIRALSLSAERALGEEEEFSFVEMAITIAVSILMVVGLFIALPVWISDKLTAFFDASHVAKNVIEGVVRGGVFVGYIAIVGLWKDIQRVFAYHGAEHKTINAYENCKPLTPESVAACSRIHRRCGTSFLVIVVVVSIVVFSFFGEGPLWVRALSRVLLLPLVIGISYEVIKGASKSDTWGKYLIMPALSLQYLTTREPDASMLEVAIKSLDVALNPHAVLSAMTENKDSFEKIGETQGTQEVNAEDGSVE